VSLFIAAGWTGVRGFSPLRVVALAQGSPTRSFVVWWHPWTSAKIDAKVSDGSLFGVITVERDYRAIAEALTGESSSHPINLPFALHDSQPARFQIEPWPAGSKRPRTHEILFKFWPPGAEPGSAEPWTCRCGRSESGDLSGHGHWEWLVPVHYYDISDGCSSF